MAAKVLIVDDEYSIRKLMKTVLEDEGYNVLLAENGQQAIETVKKVPPDVILLDLLMPGMDGLEVLKILKNDDGFTHIPIIVVTALRGLEQMVNAFELGADDFLNKPVNIIELKTRVKAHLKVKAYHDHLLEDQEKLEQEVQKRTEQLREATKRIKEASIETIYRLSRAAEYKDEETGSHIMRINRYSVAIADELGLDKEFKERLFYATPMHDVGKIGVPDAILLKPTELSPEEFEIMKQHTIIGKKILEGSEYQVIKDAETVALTHHERWDGNGYPLGLKRYDIPLMSRIMTVADVFDALVSKRPYKEPIPVDEAVRIIKMGKGTQFDPEIVDAFMKAKDIIIDIKNKYK